MILRMLTLLVLTGYALLPSTASAAGGRRYLELSTGFMAGDFGTTTSSRLISLSPTLGYMALRYDFSVTAPYLALSNETSGVRNTESGLGDIIVRAGAVLFPENSAGFSVNGSVAVKLPTADETKGLGTGETDYGAYASMQQRLQAFKLSVTAGYLSTGDPSGLVYHDGFSYGLGLARSFSRTTLYGAYERRQAVISGLKNPQEVSAGFFHLLSLDYAVKGQIFFGLNNGGPDGGGTLGLVRWF
jgi:hypothetical protein